MRRQRREDVARRIGLFHGGAARREQDNAGHAAAIQVQDERQVGSNRRRPREYS